MEVTSSDPGASDSKGMPRLSGNRNSGAPVHDALSSSDNTIQRVLIVPIKDSSPDNATKMKNASGSFYQTFAPIS